MYMYMLLWQKGGKGGTRSGKRRSQREETPLTHGFREEGKEVVGQVKVLQAGQHGDAEGEEHQLVL